MQGSSILVEGAPGTGKSTLGLEFLYRGSREFGEPGVLVVFDVSPDKIARAAAGFGWDLGALERADRLKIVFTAPKIFEQELAQVDSLLMEEARRIQARRIFVDGLGSRVAGTFDAVREAFLTLANALHRAGLTAMFSLDIRAGARAQFGPSPGAELVADTILVLRAGTGRRAVGRSLEIAKSRGHRVELGWHSMRIVPDAGIEVYPRVPLSLDRDRHEAAGFDPQIRLETGLPGLDDLVNGGVYLGSATLVLGASGTGKSLFGLQFLSEGARRGERGLFVNIEEPRAQVVASAAAVGIDLPALMARDAIRLWRPSPGEMDSDQHLHHLEELLAAFNPQRAVVDSLSAYDTIVETHTLRDALHSTVRLLKSHQVTTIYVMEDRGVLGMARAARLVPSSSFDNVIRLELVEVDDAIRLVLTLAKLRANPPNYLPRECEIVSGAGLRVLPRVIRCPPSMTPFSGPISALLRATAAAHPYRTDELT